VVLESIRRTGGLLAQPAKLGPAIARTDCDEAIERSLERRLVAFGDPWTATCGDPVPRDGDPI